mmetsp:Transcript_88386/g.249026  ORF Transcript_88386/g.249026 Transcript_88386/m.249026 type:complete len:206 (+) Transcript_88386:1694-2311(+)
MCGCSPSACKISASRSSLGTTSAIGTPTSTEMRFASTTFMAHSVPTTRRPSERVTEHRYTEPKPPCPRSSWITNNRCSSPNEVDVSSLTLRTKSESFCRKRGATFSCVVTSHSSMGFACWERASGGFCVSELDTTCRIAAPFSSLINGSVSDCGVCSPTSNLSHIAEFSRREAIVECDSLPHPFASEDCLQDASSKKVSIVWKPV